MPLDFEDQRRCTSVQPEDLHSLIVLRGLKVGLRDALKSVLNGQTGPSPRVDFFDKFQREMDKHDRGLGKNTTAPHFFRKCLLDGFRRVDGLN